MPTLQQARGEADIAGLGDGDLGVIAEHSIDFK